MGYIFITFAIAGIFILFVNLLFRMKLKKMSLTSYQQRLYKPLYRTAFGKLLFLVSNRDL